MTDSPFWKKLKCLKFLSYVCSQSYVPFLRRSRDWSLNYLLLNEVLRTKSEQKQYGGKERVDSFKLGIAHRYIF